MDKNGEVIETKEQMAINDKDSSDGEISKVINELKEITISKASISETEETRVSDESEK